LTPEQRRAAPVVYQSLCRAKELWQQGEKDADSLRRSVRESLEREPLVEHIDYISLSDGATLAELDLVKGPAILLVAVRLGQPRLIDNIILQ
jgi:pantoate--beta-alanine ligase